MAYSWDIKIAAVRAYAHIRSLRKVSRIFSVAISTLSRWHRQLLENRLQVRRTRTSKISDALIAFIRQLLDQHPFLTRIVLKRKIEDVFQISVSSTLVGVCILRAGFTCKKTRSRPCKSIDREKYAEFLSRFMTARATNRQIISIDETGFDDTSLPLKGYAPKGKRHGHHGEEHLLPQRFAPLEACITSRMTDL